MLRSLFRNKAVYLAALTAVANGAPAIAETPFAGAYGDVIIERDISGRLSVNGAGYGDGANERLRDALTEKDAFAPFSHDTVYLMLRALAQPAPEEAHISEAERAFLLSRADYPYYDGDGQILEARLLALRAAGAGKEAADLAGKIPASLMDAGSLGLRDALLAEERDFGRMCEGRDLRAEAARSNSGESALLPYEDASQFVCAAVYGEDESRVALLAELFREQYAEGGASRREGDGEAVKRLLSYVKAAEEKEPRAAFSAWLSDLQRRYFLPGSGDMPETADPFAGSETTPETQAETLFGKRKALRNASRAALADIWAAYFASRREPLPFALAERLLESKHTGAALLTLFYQRRTAGGATKMDTGLKKDAARALDGAGFSKAAAHMHRLFERR